MDEKIQLLYAKDIFDESFFLKKKNYNVDKRIL